MSVLSYRVVIGSVVALTAGVWLGLYTPPFAPKHGLSPTVSSASFSTSTTNAPSAVIYDESGEKVEIAADGSRHVTFENNLTDGQEVTLSWWDAVAKNEVLLDTLQPGAIHGAKTFVDHIWIFRLAESGKLVRSVAITETSASRVVAQQSPEWWDEYKKRTGIRWENVYPRPPVAYKIYGGDTVGTKETITSMFAHWRKGDDVSSLGGRQFNFEVETLSVQPRIVRLNNFLSDDECDSMIETAKDLGGFQRSRVTDAGVLSTSRTSSNIWVDVAASPVIEHISKRIFETMQIRYTRERARKISETYQFIHYDVNQEYKAHEDWFDVDTEDSAHYLEVLRGHNRFATFFLYLSDVEQGGETAFPKAIGHESDNACTEGFRVKPKKGSAIIFYSMTADGNLDRLSLHQGCPVIQGEKYAANVWFWEPSRFKLVDDEV